MNDVSDIVPKEVSQLNDYLMNLALLGSHWVLWLLIVLSVVSMTIILERWIFFWKNKTTDYKNFSEELTKILLSGDWQGAKNLAYQKNTISHRTAVIALEAKEKGIRATEEKITGFLIQERLKAEKGFGFLGTLGNNAPFIGLFGTVLGIIQAFHDLSLNPQGGPAMIMSGLSEALIATAVGLVVAIPAVIAYNFFQRTTKKWQQEAQSIEKIVFSHLFTKDHS